MIKFNKIEFGLLKKMWVGRGLQFFFFGGVSVSLYNSYTSISNVLTNMKMIELKMEF